MNHHLLAFVLSEWQLIVIVIIGVLLFGRKLPEIGRSLGKGIVEFKKGLKGMEEEIHDTGSPHTSSAPQQQQPAIDQPRPPQRVTASTPKFEEPAPKFQDTTPRFEPPAPKVEDKPHDTTPTPPQG
jgi:sec-independent protein translocase protein TatA